MFRSTSGIRCFVGKSTGDLQRKSELSYTLTAGHWHASTVHVPRMRVREIVSSVDLGLLHNVSGLAWIMFYVFPMNRIPEILSVLFISFVVLLIAAAIHTHVTTFCR